MYVFGSDTPSRLGLRPPSAQNQGKHLYLDWVSLRFYVNLVETLVPSISWDGCKSSGRGFRALIVLNRTTDL